MSASVSPSADTPALPPDVLSNVLSLLDISLRERCQLQLVCRAFRDAYDDPQSSAVWGSCSLERDFPDDLSFDDLSRCHAVQSPYLVIDFSATDSIVQTEVPSADRFSSQKCFRHVTT